MEKQTFQNWIITNTCFNMKSVCIMPTKCIYVLRVILWINNAINRLLFAMVTWCSFCSVGTQFYVDERYGSKVNSVVVIKICILVASKSGIAFECSKYLRHFGLLLLSKNLRELYVNNYRYLARHLLNRLFERWECVIWKIMYFYHYTKSSTLHWLCVCPHCMHVTRMLAPNEGRRLDLISTRRGSNSTSHFRVFSLFFVCFVVKCFTHFHKNSCD
jgi:hypothetical protein